MRSRRLQAAVALAVILVSFLAVSSAQTSLAIVKGPYIQAVSQSEVTIMWETNVPSSASLKVIPVSGEAEPIAKTGEASRKVHGIRVTGLSAGRAYRYEVVSATKAERTTGRGEFRALPSSGPVRFVAYGDSRTDAEAHGKVVQAILRDQEARPMFVVHTGDFVQAGKDYDRWGREFFGPAAQLIRDVSLFPCLGNHEQNADSYSSLFATPGKEKWYSIEASNVVVISLDVMYSSLLPDAAQYKWLESELKRARSQGKVPIVFFHSQVYSSGGHAKHDKDGVPSETPARHAQQYLVPLFAKYGVRLVLSGHDHFYERSENGDGVVYVVTGGGGAPIRDKDPGVRNPYSKVFKKAYHYIIIDVDGERVSVKIKGIDGKVIDSFSVPGKKAST